MTGDVAESHCGAKRDAATRVVAAHDARHVVAARVETSDRSSVCIKHTSRLVGAKAGKGAEAAGYDLDGVERSILDGGNARIRAMTGITLHAVVWRFATTKLGILAVACGIITPGHGSAERGAVDTAHRAELR